MGGGGNSQGPGGSGAGDAKDESKPSPAAPASPDAFGDTVAPQGQPQGELTLRKLHEALQDDQSAKLLEERTGIPREQLEQFAKSYEKVKSGPAAPGRDLEVKSGEHAPVKPGANLPGFDRSQRIGTKNRSSGDTMPDDTVRGMNEIGRHEAPAEFRGRVEGYKLRMARSKVAATQRGASPKANGGK